jgi:HK97 family phage portal protein
MLRALRRRADVQIERSAGDLPTYWPGVNGHMAGIGRNPMHIPAFFRGMLHRCTLISTMPLTAEIGGQPAGVPIEILEQPDPTEDRQTTLARMEASLILHGEYVAVLGSFDGDGFARAIKVVDPGQAKLELDGSWTIGKQVYGPGQILHHIPMALPGESRGVSVVELFRRTFTAEIAAAEFQQNFYLDGGQPLTIITNSEEDTPPEDLQELLQRYMAKVRGGRREPVILPAHLTVNSLALNNRDAQFLESREFAITDIANIVGVPPYYVGAPGSSSTYSNITDQRRDLLDTYLRGSIYAIERGFTSLLPEGLKAKFDTKSFLRADARGTAETLAIESQWMTINEIRAVEGLPPIPGGDVIGSTVLPGAAPAASQEVPAGAV